MGEPRSSQTFSVQSHISVEILCPGCEAVSRWRMPPSLVSLHFIFLFLCWLPLSSSFISYCSIIQAVTTRWVLFLLRIRFHFMVFHYQGYCRIYSSPFCSRLSCPLPPVLVGGA